MLVDYDFQRLKDVFQDFHNATGVNANLVKADFLFSECNEPIHNGYCTLVQSVECGQKQCYLSDISLLEKCKKSRQPEMHICHAGLIDIVIPILYDDVVLAYIILGQIKQNPVFNRNIDAITKYGIDATELQQRYDKLQRFGPKRIQSLINIATILARHVLLENMLKPSMNKNIKSAVDYINENLENPLTVQSVSRGIGISKSVLYRSFHSYFNCTVNQYINAKRVEKSINLLLKTNMSIEEISQNVGFTSASYYSRIFKKQNGCSPLTFRKKNL